MADYLCSVTIGIPVYNAEKYIERCLISVLDQTFEDFEVLVVDDRGTDNSIQKVEEIANNHVNGKKLRIVHHDRNKGVAEARNTIIDEASGKYLYFGWYGYFDGFFKVYKGNSLYHSEYLEGYDEDREWDLEGMVPGTYTAKLVTYNGITLGISKIVIKKSSMQS